jgi:hypothetical protein
VPTVVEPLVQPMQTAPMSSTASAVAAVRLSPESLGLIDRNYSSLGCGMPDYPSRSALRVHGGTGRFRVSSDGSSHWARGEVVMMPTRMAAAISLVLSLAACSQQSGPSSGTPAASTAATTGAVAGVVRMYGGPMNPQTGKQALKGSPGPDWTVKVLSGGHAVAETKSNAAGKFRFDLAPGRYTLACGREPSVVVVAGQTVSVDCDVPVP